MNMKSYLKGLGTGIIITTLVFAIALKIQPSSKLESQETTTAGSVLNSTKKATETEAVSTDNQNETSGTSAAQESQTSQESGTASQDTTATSGTESAGEKKNVTVEISDAPYAETACKVLQEAGIIDDWKDFNQYLMDSGYETLVRNGSYDLYAGEDYDSIAKTITGRN